VILRNIFVVLMMSLTLGACDARLDLWRRATDDIRTFFTIVPCAENVAPSSLESRKFYQVLTTRWWVNDPCRGAICPPLSREHPDRYAFGVNFVGDSGAAVDRRMWIIDRKDILAFSVNMYKYDVPSWFHRPPAGRSGETCVALVTVPWQKIRNRPYWVADETLSADPATSKTTDDTAGLIVMLLLAIFAAGTGFVAAGYFDAPAQRVGGVVRSLLFAGAALALLMYIRTNYIVEPHARLVQVQDFYRFYGQLPKSGANLLPISGQSASRLFAGPPLTTDLTPSTDAFRTVAWIALLGWIILNIKRLYMGLYWVFVPLPLEVKFRRARARGDWPRAQEIVEAVRQGTMNKAAWQSRAMALKAQRFASELDSATERLRKSSRS
jgi:hypothetical protein